MSSSANDAAGPATADLRPAVDAPARKAATLVVVRDASPGIEVLLYRRAERGDHYSGAWVFPGGVVEASDRAARFACVGLDDAEASRRLGLERDGLDYWIAAIRECFEEAGVLFAYEADGSIVDLDRDDAARLGPWRQALHRGDRGVDALCAAEDLRLATDRLVYLSHWLTPVARSKRFDARFFIAAMPAAQTPLHDGAEMVEQLWVRPADALARGEALKLLTPTQTTLKLLSQFEDVEALLAWASGPRTVGVTMPRVGNGRLGQRPVLPDEPAWAELGRIDPGGHGNGSYEIVPGQPVRLSSRVIRVTAGNGSVMTGPGTNAYLVGVEGGDEWAVIDPGPVLDGHVEAILAAAPGRITRIFVTHTHHDHSPATVALQARTGATVHGLAPLHREWQDATFVADVTLRGGERIVLGDGTTLAVIHTPGHAANHLCYLLEEEQTLFTGDHVMQASTVVINPPDGGMRAYIASLESLLDLELAWLAPGHGFLMAEPRRAMEKIIAHRLAREAKVIAALRDLGPAGCDTLLVRVYADVPERLHPMAMRSLTAHLLKLRDDGAASLDAESRWSTTAAST